MGIPGILRPRTSSELMDAAFALARRFAKDLLPLSLLIGVPIAALLWLPYSGGGHRHSLSSRGVEHFPLTLCVIPILDGVRMWLLEAALIDVVTAGRVDWPAARRRVAAVFWRLLGAGLAFWGLTVLSSLAFVVPGVIYFLHRRFYAEILLAEGRAQGFGLRRSFALTDGSLGRLGLIIVGYGLLQISLSMGSGLWQSSLLGALFSWVVSSCLSLPAAAFYVLLYYDLRSRREGLDLLSREVELEAGGRVPAGAT